MNPLIVGGALWLWIRHHKAAQHAVPPSSGGSGVDTGTVSSMPAVIGLPTTLSSQIATMIPHIPELQNAGGPTAIAQAVQTVAQLDPRHAGAVSEIATGASASLVALVRDAAQYGGLTAWAAALQLHADQRLAALHAERVAAPDATAVRHAARIDTYTMLRPVDLALAAAKAWPGDAAYLAPYITAAQAAIDSTRAQYPNLSVLDTLQAQLNAIK